MSPASIVGSVEGLGEVTGVGDGCSEGIGVGDGCGVAVEPCLGVGVGTSAVEELMGVSVGARIVGVVSSLRATWDTQAGTVKIKTTNIMAKRPKWPAAEPFWIEEACRFDFTNVSSLTRVPLINSRLGVN